MAQTSTSSAAAAAAGVSSDAQQQLKDFWDNAMTGIKALTTVRKNNNLFCSFRKFDLMW